MQGSDSHLSLLSSGQLAVAVLTVELTGNKTHSSLCSVKRRLGGSIAGAIADVQVKPLIAPRQQRRFLKQC